MTPAQLTADNGAGLAGQADQSTMLLLLSLLSRVAAVTVAGARRLCLGVPFLSLAFCLSRTTRCCRCLCFAEVSTKLRRGESDHNLVGNLAEIMFIAFG